MIEIITNETTVELLDSPTTIDLSAAINLDLITTEVQAVEVLAVGPQGPPGVDGEVDTNGAAMLSSPNVFTEVNTTPGLRVGTTTVSTDYTMLATDFEVLVDATSGPIQITLPLALATGQIYRVKKIDATTNIVTISAQSGDLIDDSISVNLIDQWANVQLLDAAVNYWDNGSPSVDVSVTSTDVADLVQIASAAATSADQHANTVSARAVSISAELVSLMNSADAALSQRIDLASGTGGGGSVTSNEVSVRVQVASAAATSADAHANTVSARVVSVSAELASLLASASANLKSIIAVSVQTASAAATAADTHANTVSVRAVSISNELGSLLASASLALETHINAVSAAGVTGGASVTSQELSVRVQTASAAATSADAHANTVSARAVSISAELASLVNIASLAATSADAHANAVSVRAVSISNELGSLVASLSANLISKIAVVSLSANAISARVVSVSAELASLVQIASLAATSADGHANTVSVRAVSISNELGSLLASASAALETHAVAASAAATSAINKAVSDNASLSAVLATSIQTASAAAAAADTHANTVSARAVSISAELVSLMNSADAALSLRVTSVGGLAGGGSVTSTELSAGLLSVSRQTFGLTQPYVFDTTTTDSDPGSGKLRLNNVTVSSATFIYADNNNAAGSNVTTMLDTWFSTFSGGAKPLIILSKKTDLSVYAAFQSGTAIVDGTGYRKIAVSYIDSNGSFSNNDEIVLTFNHLDYTSAVASLNTHINTASARAVSISAEVVSLMNSADTALSLRVTSVAGLAGAGASMTSQEISVTEAALSNRITSVAGMAGGGSVTSTELSAARYIANTTQTDVDYTASIGDALTLVKMNSASAHNFTVPPNSSVAFPIGTQIVVEQAGAGTVTIVAGGGVTLEGTPLAMPNQYSTVVLIKQATDTWLVGNIGGVMASADAALSLRITSADTAVSAQALSQNNVISARVVSVSSELASLIASAASRKALNTANQASITVSTCSTVSGVSLIVSAGVTYHFEFQIPFTCMLPSGITVGVIGPATNQYFANYQIPGAIAHVSVLPAANAVVPYNAQVRAIGTKVSTQSITLTGTTLMAYAWGTINPSATGSLKFVIGPNTSGGTNSGVIALAGANIITLRMSG